jgi:hypothetical protein
MSAVHTSAPTRWAAPAVLSGIGFGALQVAAPVALSWVAPATVQSLALTMIAGVYIGFAVADGRPRVIAVEATAVAVFVVLAAIAVTSSPWVLVAAYAAHGAKDAWQSRTQFVANTRWWPPFCAAVDWFVAVALVIEIALGVQFR